MVVYQKWQIWGMNTPSTDKGKYPNPRIDLLLCWWVRVVGKIFAESEWKAKYRSSLASLPRPGRSQTEPHSCWNEWNWIGHSGTTTPRSLTTNAMMVHAAPIWWLHYFDSVGSKCPKSVVIFPWCCTLGTTMTKTTNVRAVTIWWPLFWQFGLKTVRDEWSDNFGRGGKVFLPPQRPTFAKIKTYLLLQRSTAQLQKVKRISQLQHKTFLISPWILVNVTKILFVRENSKTKKYGNGHPRSSSKLWHCIGAILHSWIVLNNYCWQLKNNTTEAWIKIFLQINFGLPQWTSIAHISQWRQLRRECKHIIFKEFYHIEGKRDPCALLQTVCISTDNV